MTRFFSHSSGFTLFEIIVAIFILSFAIVPMMKSFSPAMMSAKQVEASAVITNRARATLERLMLVEPDTLGIKADDVQPLSGNDVFGDADETFAFGGKLYAPDITINDVSGDGSKTLFLLTVILSDIRFSTLKADY